MKDKKNLIILALLLVMVVMSYGFVSYSNKAIEESRSSKIKKWDVAVTNVEAETTDTASSGEIKQTEGTVTVKPILRDVNDSVVYRVTITNNGLIDAKLSDSIFTIKDPNSVVVFTYDKDTKVIKSKESVTVTIIAKMDRERFIEPADATNELTAMFEYIQY